VQATGFDAFLTLLNWPLIFAQAGFVCSSLLLAVGDLGSKKEKGCCIHICGSLLKIVAKGESGNAAEMDRFFWKSAKFLFSRFIKFY
jgi:hypothetical protein